MKKRSGHSPNWGGRRPGAGRPPKGDRAGVSHLSRPQFSKLSTLLVTLRLAPHARGRALRPEIESALSIGAARFDARIVRAALRDERVLLLCEASSPDALRMTIQGFSVRFARNLNAALGRKGRVFADRYEARLVKEPAEIAKAFAGATELKKVDLPPPRTAAARSR